MGNTATTAEDGDDFAEFDGVETLGYRVLGVQPNSPASKAGLVSFFDFLVGANGAMLLGSGEGLEEGEEYDDIDFPALLHENRGRPVELLVWNIKAQEKRLVDLIPNEFEGGVGLLGVTIKLDDYGGADERLVRVLDVVEGGPASTAGLVKEKDFLLGTTTQNFSDTAVLASVLEEHIDQVVEIYVYNADSDMVRVVGLVPSFTWGGVGLLGAEVGVGYLHRLPNSCRSTIGKSVERKVRWTNKDHADGGSEGNSGVVEVEPHLEMEVERDEITGLTNPEDGTRQPHELGTSERSMEVVSLSASSGASDGKISSKGQPSSELVEETKEELPPKPRLLISEETKTDAANFFSAPATASEALDTSSNASSLPAPPKMHY